MLQLLLFHIVRLADKRLVDLLNPMVSAQYRLSVSAPEKCICIGQVYPYWSWSSLWTVPSMRRMAW
jgi:hypothetical protein